MNYTKKVMKPMCKKSIFKKQLIKLTKNFIFSVNYLLIKEIDEDFMWVVSYHWFQFPNVCF